MSKPKLYALLVGIDAYRYPVRPLNGCVNDILNFKKYLENTENKNFDLKIEVLTNQNATKANIVRGFEQHLGKAAGSDLALFYYAGHGAQEKADTSVWRFEPDGKLEGLVCMDSIPSTGQAYNLLVDKELRFLIHRLAHGKTGSPKAEMPHILTIFDCCHSGSNTRNVYIAKESKAVAERRFKPMPAPRGETRMGSILPARKWDDFIFSKSVNPADLHSKPLQDVLPEGRHIQLAACQSDESAYEAGGSGVFSRNLIEVLQRSNGAISYFDLKNRLRYFIKNQFQQSPQIYGAGGQEFARDLYKGFLNKDVANGPLYGNIVFNPKSGWIMDIGAIHGVSMQADKVKVRQVGISDKIFDARIQTVKASETLLTFDPATEATLSRDKGLYQGFVEGFQSAPVRIFVYNQDKDVQAEKGLREKISGTIKNLSLADREREADYTVQLREGRCVITRPGDPFRPLVFPRKGYSDSSFKEIVQDLTHISQWEYVKNLNNDGPNRLPLDAVAIEFFKVQPDGREVAVTPDGDGTVRTTFDAQPGSSRHYGGDIRIKVSNRSPFPVFVSLLYLGSTFEVVGDLFSGKVTKLEPFANNGQVWVFDGSNIPLLYEEAVEYFNHPDSTTYFKLIVSREEFLVDTLEQTALPDPALLIKPTRSMERGITRPQNNADADAWITLLYTLRIANPRFDKVPKKEACKWVNADSAPFLSKLYKL
jgi:hypothetical protein